MIGQNSSGPNLFRSTSLAPGSVSASLAQHGPSHCNGVPPVSIDSIKNDLQALVQHDLLEEAGDVKEDRYVFSSANLKDQIYTQIHSTWRISLHRNLALLFEAEYELAQQGKDSSQVQSS